MRGLLFPVASIAIGLTFFFLVIGFNHGWFDALTVVASIAGFLIGGAMLLAGIFGLLEYFREP